MTEDEWDACADATAMLGHLGARAGERKLRLLAAACARARWSGVVDPEVWGAVELAERSADGEATRDDLRAAEDELWCIGFGGGGSDPESLLVAEIAVHPSTLAAAQGTIARVAAAAPALVREIFGNPFRDARFVPDWRGGERGELARAIYDKRRFEDLPRLGHLLTEAGCDERTLLAHLQSPGPHSRGCWALDAVLGKGPGKDILTDADWMGETHPFQMLNAWRFLRGKPSPRKLRLLLCACCRRFAPLIAEEALARAVDLAEAYADGRVGAAALAEAHAHALALAEARGDTLSRMGGDSPERSALDGAWKAACAAANASAPDGRHFENENGMHSVARDGGRGRDTEDAEQAGLIREVLGNPLQHVVADATWSPSDVGAIRDLAQRIYEERTFARLPALADRLEEAGYIDALVLSHLREPGPHVRGCWALDALLGS